MKFTDELFAEIVRLRPKEGQPFDPPAELGFHCPLCRYSLMHNGEYDPRLVWSKYNGFLRCSVCKRHYPAALCMPDIERTTKIYLASVKEVVERSGRSPDRAGEIAEALPQRRLRRLWR